MVLTPYGCYVNSLTFTYVRIDEHGREEEEGE